MNENTESPVGISAERFLNRLADIEYSKYSFWRYAYIDKHALLIPEYINNAKSWDLKHAVDQIESVIKDIAFEHNYKNYSEEQIHFANESLSFDSYQSTVERHINEMLRALGGESADFKLFKTEDGSYKITELDMRFLLYLEETYYFKDAINIRKGNYDIVSEEYIDYIQMGFENIAEYNKMDFPLDDIIRKLNEIRMCICKRELKMTVEMICDMVKNRIISRIDTLEECRKFEELLDSQHNEIMNYRNDR